MTKKHIPEYFRSSDETDSADEAFIFTKKRKPDSFFIDLTEGESKSKKQKKLFSDTNDNIDSVRKCEQEVINQSGFDSEVQVLKFVPGSSSNEKAEGPKCNVQACMVDSSSMIEVSTPKLFSPPRIVRVAGANFSKSADVIDLTQKNDSPIDKEDEEVVPDSPQACTSKAKEDVCVVCEVLESPQSPVPQNQLMDKTARAIFDSIWYGRLFFKQNIMHKCNDIKPGHEYQK